MRWAVLVSMILPSLLQAQQPILIHRATVNAASLAPFGLPNAPLARGSIFTIFGENLGPTQSVQVSAFPLEKSLANVTLAFTQADATTVDAIPIFVSASQINAILPSTAKPGLASLRVTYQNRKSNAITLQIADSAPGIFAVSSGGFGPGVVQNFVAANNQPINSLNRPATRGQTITIWATGLGPVTFPDNIAPTAGDVAAPVSVTIGGRPATKAYSGRSPCCSGVDQIVVTVPDDAPLGCWVPVQVKAAGVASNTVTMSIAASGATTCSDPNNVLSSLARASGTQGFIHVQRVNAISDVTQSLSNVELDNIYARFINKPASEFAFDPYLSYPPAGTCLVHQTAGDPSINKNPRGAPAAYISPRPSLTFNNGVVNAPSLGTNSTYYSFSLGGAADGTSIGIPLANSDAKVLFDPGGPNATALPLKLVNPPTWTQRTSLHVIDRKVPLVLNFTPSDASASTAITLYAYTTSINATVEIQCLAPPAASTFTIPADTLAILRISYKEIDGSYSELAIGTLSAAGSTAFSNSVIASGMLLNSPWLRVSVVTQ